MSTFTIRVTSSATNKAGTAYGQQPDLGAPSFLDMIVTNSTDPVIVNGVYDAYCLNPLIDILLSPTTYSASGAEGDSLDSFTSIQPVGLSDLTQLQVDQLNWLLAQNFTSDAKYGGQFNYGEVQTAIWKIVGFTDQQIHDAGLDRFLNDNNRNVVSSSDITFLVQAAQNAVASGNGVLPTDSFFTAVIDPAGNAQPLIIQLQSAKLGNYVWFDQNSDGIQDANEAGVDNVIVQLYDSQGNLLAETTTGDDYSTAAVEHGYYQFTGLKAGDYQVKFITPADMAFTVKDANGNGSDAADSDADITTGETGIINLVAGESDQTIDAGLIAENISEPTSLGDYVWVDSNYDGLQNDSAASGLNGVTVNLYDGNGNLVATTETANDVNGNPGYYLFDNLVPGDYQVEFVQPDGYAFTKQDQGADDGADSDADTSTGLTVTTSLTSGENDLSWDAGLVKLASLGDRVWEDSNADGVQDAGENGIADVTVNLYDCVTNDLLATTTTDADGNYSFTGLLPGTYHVEFVAPNGYVFTAQDVTAEALGNDSDADDAGITGCYTVNSGDNIDTVDAGLYQTASLGDYVWIDDNYDGKQNEANGNGLNGVTVNLYDGNGNLVATTETANDVNGNPGYYFFDALVPGDYQVEFVQPDGYAFTKQDQGADDGADSDADTSTGLTVTTSLTSGENDLSWDAGLVKLASLGDRVWEDSNADGVQDAGENGIADVTVNLYDCVTNDLLATTTTDADGNYSFTGLLPGTYHVEFVAPNGYVFTAQDVTAEALGNDSDADSAGITGCYTVNSGDNIDTVDAGLYQTASLGDYVWIDDNYDGKQNEANGNGLNGVTVNLYDGNGNLVATTETANDVNGNPGYYLFDNLVPGDYQVEFVQPDGYAFTKQDQGADDAADSDADTTTGLTVTTSLTSGENDLSWDAGLVKLASLGDRVWEDSNADGVQDAGENGIADVTVNLYDCVTNDLLATTTTDADGNYSFTGLLPGTYHVEFVAPNGYVFTAQDVTAEALGNDSDADSAGITGCYTVNSGDNIDTVDAGLYQTASLGDYVWVDDNYDGKQNEANGNGLNGVTVNLYDGNGNLVATTETANDVNGNPGYYLFDNLVPGDYQVEFVQPDGYAFTKQDQGADDAADSDADTTTGLTVTTSLTSGENDLSWDAGLVKLASLGDRVWEDSNADGVQDAGENGIADVTVNLYDCVTNDLLATTTTDADGNYSFTGLLPGTYHVEFVAPNGYVFTAQDVTAEALGNDSDADSAGITGCYTVNSGDNIDTVDAGLYQLASIGNRIWYDTNANGIQDAGESGVAGVVVDLKDNNGLGAVLQTTTTDANGYYLFDNLKPGDYHIDIQEDTLPDGYEFTTPNAGSNDELDSDVSTVYGAETVPLSWGVMDKTTLTSGEVDLSWDAGIVAKKATIGDKIWHDANANGIQDAGEQGIAGVTVELRDNTGTYGNILETTTTDANGNYLFDNLNPGDYHIDIVESTLPSGYQFTKANIGGNDNVDSDVSTQYGSTTVPLNYGIMDKTTLSAGEVDLSWDAGVYFIGVDVEKYVSSTQCVTKNNCGGEGASVNDWKSNCNFSSSWSYNWWSGWQETKTPTGWNGISDCKASDTFNSVFGVNCSGGNKSLYDILCSTGTGSQDVMMRECVAAYLNACHTGVDFAYSKEEVCAQTKYALSCGSFTDTINMFSYENKLGCNYTDSKHTYNCTVDTTLYDADAAPGLEVKTGTNVTFTYIVKNTGDTALKNVSLVDDKIATVTYVSGDSNKNGFLDVGESWTYTASEAAVSGLRTNIATVTGYDSISGTKVTDSDAANYTGSSALKSSLGDRVWEDLDMDGKQEAGENGIGNVTVKLQYAGADGKFDTADDKAYTTKTDASGYYQFSNLDAGKYQVTVVSPSGYYVTKSNQGSNDAIDSDIDSSGKTSVIDLAAGQQNLTIDAGLYRKASIGDRIWEDSDHDGIQDVGEIGIKGVKVMLQNSSGTTLQTAYTDSAGNYKFVNLDPGTYRLCFDKANVSHYSYWNYWANMNDWYWDVKANVGTNDNIDSDALSDGTKANVVYTQYTQLVSGENDMSWDAAITPVVIDLNGDGVQTVSRADAAGSFDLFGTGTKVESGWISGDDGFLAVDSNGNGLIDNISELFGGSEIGAGFAKLAAFDSNGDGLVDANDADFSSLLIWKDGNGNHQTDAGELMSLSEAGVSSLTVGHTDLPFIDAQGNLHFERSSATLADGQSVDMTDVYFNVSTDDVVAAGGQAISFADLIAQVGVSNADESLWLA
ncbi:SdrD B-like domain-containing protein [Methylomonas sp. HYX-M1]|uniref:SdrD B-like domain-containing protein n=1 Tax=Methylomonas sp. HYX-M1 TaxID=3139307 RepID=UPI00345BF89D